MDGSNSRPYLRFATISLLIIVMVSTAAALAGVRIVAVGQQRSFAEEWDRSLATPINEILAADDGGELSPAVRARVDAVVQPLLAGSLSGVRIYTTDGATVYSGGEPAIDRDPLTAGRYSRTETAAGAGVFAGYSRKSGGIVEITSDLAPVDNAIAAARWELLFAISTFAATVWVLLLGAFWFGIRTFRQEHGQLAHLYDTGQQLRESLDLHDVLAKLASDATRLSHSQYGLIALIDETSGELLLKTTFEQATGMVALHQRALDEWFIHRAIATKQIVVSGQGAERYKQYFTEDAEISKDGALLAVPMSLGGRIIGAVSVLRASISRDGGFSPQEVRLVEELAAQAVTAVEQAQLFAKVRADNNALEQGYDTTLKALMAALDAKDDATEGHCERVAKLTAQLARAMGVAPSLLVHIERGALLHDVGKIGVPDAILKKPKALNDNEWEAMRKHPLLAGLMVSKIGFLEPALPILLYHHEKYDGTGYPFGLSGENIPVEARVFSVIDAYDAMTSDRPYREAMAHDEAMAEVRRHSARQFDPAVVEAFEALMLEHPELRQSTAAPPMLDSSDHDDDLLLSAEESAA